MGAFLKGAFSKGANLEGAFLKGAFLEGAFLQHNRYTVAAALLSASQFIFSSCNSWQS